MSDRMGYYAGNEMPASCCGKTTFWDGIGMICWKCLQADVVTQRDCDDACTDCGDTAQRGECECGHGNV